jgi:soluble lytic murein transglycosylase-like protein
MIYLTITLLSSLYGIDPALTYRMATIESSLNPKALSKTGDGGILQLNRKYHKFHNPDLIFNYETNISLALKTLQELKTKCKHTLNNSYILCYNLGVRGASKIKNPFNQTYYKKTKLVWRI